MDDNIYLICNHDLRKRLSNIDGYQMDLGRKYSEKDHKGIRKRNIQDLFVLKFLKDYKRLIFKCGVFGPISIYTLDSLEGKSSCIICKNDEFEEIIYNEIDITLDFEKFLLEKIIGIPNEEN